MKRFRRQPARFGAPVHLIVKTEAMTMAATTKITAPAIKNAAIVETAPKVRADGADAPPSPAETPPAKTPAQIAEAAPNAVSDPAPATTLDEASGAIVEPAVTAAVDVGHEAVDANPRAGTTALQNAIDFNDAKRAEPNDPGFAGQGIDRSVYGDAVPQTPEGVARPAGGDKA